MSDWAQWPQRLLIAVVKAYRLLLSPWLGNQCGYEPTCSVYALQALEQHGALCGSYLAARRIIRCRPGCPGGHDPVPEQCSRLFAWRSQRPSSTEKKSS
jgi:putative membrane protein insertion efficiency factor